MAVLKAKGDLAEVMVAADILRRGHKVAFPYGEDWEYDLIACRGGSLERVQVKHARSNGATLVVRCRSHSVTAGRVRRVTRYTAASVDWIAVWDATTEECFYVPAVAFDGHAELRLRMTPARNGQVRGIRPVAEYRRF